MSGRYPASVDVVIVGSGPTGAAYARILSERAPDATIAMFEVGPTVSDPPGAHVKNIIDPDERAQAQVRSEGPLARERRRSRRRDRQNRRSAVRGPARSCSRTAIRSRARTACPSRRSRATSAVWPRTGPVPVRGPTTASASASSMTLASSTSCSTRATDCSGSPTTAFDSSPHASLVRERLAAAEDDGRDPHERVQRMPLAVHRRDDGRLVWSGSDVVMGEVTRGNPNFHLFDESLVTRVLRADGRAAGVAVTDRAHRR